MTWLGEPTCDGGGEPAPTVPRTRCNLDEIQSPCSLWEAWPTNKEAWPTSEKAWPTHEEAGPTEEALEEGQVEGSVTQPQPSVSPRGSLTAGAKSVPIREALAVWLTLDSSVAGPSSRLAGWYRKISTLGQGLGLEGRNAGLWLFFHTWLPVISSLHRSRWTPAYSAGTAPTAVSTVKLFSLIGFHVT